ncbi:MAG: Ig-like domain-containing protein, partial [Geobacteraceae bacterium]|nr:Ig-like domain-containing protein [Geobacteraceae bacterium]
MRKMIIGLLAGFLTLVFVAGAQATPSVTAVYPLAGATGVPTNVTLTATFSDTMDASSILEKTTNPNRHNARFRLYKGAPLRNWSPEIDGTVTYDSLTKTASFTLVNNLDANTTYT